MVSANWKENFSIYSSLTLWEAHVSAWHMYLTGWDLIPFSLSYFLLKMVLVMNEFYCHKKIVNYSTKTLKRLWYDIINNLQIRFYTSARFQMFYWIVGVLKNLANFTGRNLFQVKYERKSLTLYPCSLHPLYKRDSCTQLLSSELWRTFKNTFLLEHSWASASTYLNQTNTWKWVFY